MTRIKLFIGEPKPVAIISLVSVRMQHFATFLYGFFCYIFQNGIQTVARFSDYRICNN